MRYHSVASLKTVDAFRARLAELGIELPLQDPLPPPDELPLAQPIEINGRTIGNRFAILPMEGWDGTRDGRPSELTLRRWRHFGSSGAKLIWGGEAAAVRHDGRANPNQLLINEQTMGDIQSLRQALVDSHCQAGGNTEDLLIGLQLTHSGRYSKPNAHDRPEPRTVYRHPILDQRMQPAIGEHSQLSDAELDELVAAFVQAAVLADRAGFEFVDIKHCHGYLGHELLSGYQRAGKYGGSFENRTRFLRDIISGIRHASPTLMVGVRVSVFDFAPFERGESGIGQPVPTKQHPFGGTADGLGIDLSETIRLLELLRELNVRLVCTTAGCPYYNAHIQRPALFPPSDGYLPPEDPLVGAARQIEVTAQLKRRFPDLVFVGSGYSYLQEWLPAVGSGAVRSCMTDFVGLGRMTLAYPQLPADVLAGRPLQRKRICRTFSQCTTGPRLGLISGCFPLDPFYKQRPEREQIRRQKGSPD